jgi:hypothetical protein
MTDFLSLIITTIFCLYVTFIGLTVITFMRSVTKPEPYKSDRDNEDEIMVALNARQLDSLLINAIEGRLHEIEIDEVLRDDLTDDFIMIAISYGDGRVRQATQTHY